MKNVNQEIPVITTGEGSKQKVSPLLLRKYLESEGFGQFMTTNDRTTKRFFFRNDENVLRIILRTTSVTLSSSNLSHF